MKLETKLKTYLQENPLGQERRNKVKCIRNVIQRDHPAIQGVEKEVMEQIVDEIIYYERKWRDLLLKNPELRGKDYDGRGFKSKEQLEQEAQIGLEVIEIGYNQKLHI